MKKLAIITARGGSKRIPRKNIKKFCGKPIMVYSIEAALSSNLFDEVMVSTDDEEIVEIARRYGAKVPFMRSKKNSDDFAGTTVVLLEVIQDYSKLNKKFDYVCCIYPTAPFLTGQKLKESYEKLIQTNADALIPIVNFDFPPQRAMYIKNNRLKFQYPEYEKYRTQELDPLYHDCGQFYWLRTQKLLEEKTIFLENTVSFIIPESEARDIDTDEDWKIGEILYKYNISVRSKSESQF